MNIVYTPCPKCGDEFELSLRFECDGVIRCEAINQLCDCEFTDEEMEALENAALKAAENG